MLLASISDSSGQTSRLANWEKREKEERTMAKAMKKKAPKTVSKSKAKSKVVAKRSGSARRKAAPKRRTTAKRRTARR